MASHKANWREKPSTRRKHQSTKGKDINTTLLFIRVALEGVIKETDMVLEAKIDAEVALNVMKDRMQRMENHDLTTKEHPEMYLKMTKERISYATAPLYTRIKQLTQ